MRTRSHVLAAAVVAAIASGRAEAETRAGQGWQLEIVAPPTAKAGTATTATLMLRTTGAWKLNTEYPFKLELKAGDGVKVARPTLRKQDARRYDEHGAALDVAITVATAGQAEIRGTVRFATCDEETCAPHRESFTITVAAR